MYKKKLIRKNIILSVFFLLIIVIGIISFIIPHTFSNFVTIENVWSGEIATSFSGGNGTKSNPYQITNGEELAYFKQVIEGFNGNDYKDKYYALSSNIDMGNLSFEPIGNEEKTFSGHFDGQGYSIKNLNISKKVRIASNSYIGIFAEINNATIENINIVNATIKAKETNDLYTGIISGSVKNATIKNAVLSNCTIILNANNDAKNIYVGNISGVANNSEMQNLYINALVNTSEKANTGSISGKFDSQSSVDNILIDSNIANDNLKSKTVYTIENVPSNFLKTLNKNISSSYNWTLKDDKYSIERKAEVKKVNLNLQSIQPIALSNPITAHQSGIDGRVVYVNDLESDYNYYLGLNYTSSEGQRLPTMDNKNIYSDKNLVKAQVSYSGSFTRNGTALNGTVSTTENQNKYVYYKYYVVNTNNTASLNDDYIDIELIDNPFTNRPKDFGFNGWLTSYVGAEISYDNSYYVRHAKVPVTYTNSLPDDIVIDFTAVWTEADVRISNSNATANLTNAISAFKDKSMQQRAVTKVVQEPIYGTINDNVMDGYYIQQAVNYNDDYPSGAHDAAGNRIDMTTGIITASALNVRSGPGTGYGTVGSSIPRNTKVTIHSVANSGSGCSDPWMEISTNTVRGYGCSTYISNIVEPICKTTGGCTVYLDQSGTKYNSNLTYYHIVNGTMVRLDPATLNQRPIIGYRDVTYELFGSNDNMSGYYEQVSLKNGQSLNGYYDNGGVLHTSGTCTSSTCTYYKLIQYYDENGNPNNFDKNKSYYYLVTRDTNLIILEHDLTGAWGTSQTKPLTITSSYGGQQYNATWTVSSTYVKANDDLGIENVTISSARAAQEENPATGTETSRTLYGNWHNVKVGRGIKKTASNQVNFSSAIGGGNSNTGSTSNLTKYRFIVESGYYSTTSQACGAYSSATRNAYIKGEAIYGNDYDRVSNNNNNLDVYYTSSGSWGCFIRGANRTDNAINQTYKSGKFGSRRPTTSGASSNYYTYGVYVGGRTYGRTHTTRIVTVEGGWIYNLIGGPLVDNDIVGYNSALFYMKGGEVDAIYGGAGLTETYGNRVIQITGGRVNYSVFGGSNGITGSNGDGTLTGSPYIYVGGNAVIGSESNVNSNATLSGFEAGSIFGIGNGKSGTDSIGTASNSYIIIDGNARILRNVYGGGNYGAVGISSSTSSSETKINVLNGMVEGSIFGGGNRNGSGSTSKAATVTINIYDGKINGSVYGGSNETGIIYGNVNINHYGGTIEKDVYGGGYGGTINTSGGTFIQKNVNITIGNKNYSTTPTINGSVYGGSAFGTVNGITHTETASSDSVNVTVNKGLIKNSVFGGGKGSTTYTPYVIGNINVNINDGNISKVFGGNDAAGKPNGSINVYLNGGTIGDTFGGGNNASVKTNHVYLRGSTVNNIFGGSNASGTVDTSNVITTSGTVDNIYGGNNTGGVTTTSNVQIDGGTINGIVYGGGRLATTGTTNVTLNGSTIKDVFGGGEQASVTNNTNVIQNKSTVTNLYGGSNSGGDIPVSNITINGGSTTSAFGGNNADGHTTTTNITVNDGTVTNIYGGGNQVGVTTSNINLGSGAIGDVYGGSNQKGDVTNTNILTIDTAKNDLNVNSVYGGNNLGGETTTTIIYLKKGKYGDVFGGGNRAITSGDTAVGITNASVTNSVYGGGNNADVYGDTNVNIYGETNIGKSIFGGGNHGDIGRAEDDNSVATVNIAGAVVGSHVYGGCNTAIVHGHTKVNIGYNAIPEMGTNSGGDIHINGTVFGGGEANEAGSDTYDFTFISVTEGIDILIDGTGYGSNALQFSISGSIFGSGNASSSSGPSNIYIKKLGTRDEPNAAISIQRADLVTLDNSTIELIGTTDRTNEYSDIKYSFNRIKDLKIKNSSTLLLRENANMLEKFTSLVDIDGEEVKAQVTIDKDSKKIVKNTDNRLYMLAGKKLNVTIDQSATTYGVVSGMTFFGMYEKFSTGRYNYGMYDDDMTFDSKVDSSSLIVGGSYVAGLHNTNHDIEVDGYYTNYLDDGFSELTVDYIEPTPPDSNYYMWMIGTPAINYSFNLTASKYSSFGTYELQMVEFSKGNTIFDVIGFNGAGLEEGIDLVDSATVPKLARSNEEANHILGLSMKTETTEWTSYGTTKFLYEDAISSHTGQDEYVTDDQSVPPSLMFYLYHAKNIASNLELGTVVINLQAKTPINPIEYDIQYITITITINTKEYDDEDAYDASITYSKKYEMPSATTVNITNKSQFTTYFGLAAQASSFDAFYGKNNDYYHTLVSSYAFPVGTKMTMLDYGADEKNPTYYYYIVDENDYRRAQNELQNNFEVTYPLSKFIKMDSTSSNNTYSDSESNQLYFHDNIDFVMEEFIVIFDLQNTDITGEHLNNTIRFELRDSEDWTLVNVLNIRQDYMIYNLYESSNVVLDENIKFDNNYLYYDIDKNLEYATIVDYNQTELRQSIIDTNYESSSMGINIAFYDRSGNQLSSTLLSGTTIDLDDTTYYVDADGVYRIKLADKVAKLNKNLMLNVGSPLPIGNYTLRITLFASNDGLHNNNDKEPTVKDINVIVVGNNNSIVAEMEDESKLIIGETGLNMKDSKEEKITIKYSSVLANPNIRISVYKRNVDSANTNEYEEIAIDQLFKDAFVYPQEPLEKASEYEYIVTTAPQNNMVLTYKLNDELITGTYRLVFRLYDGNQLIDDDIEYIIIRKNV